MPSVFDSRCKKLCTMFRLLPLCLDAETEPDSSLHGNCSGGVGCRRSAKSRCSPKLPGNATAVAIMPSVNVKCRERDWTQNHSEERRHQIENVLMDVDDFEQEITVAAEQWPLHN